MVVVNSRCLSFLRCSSSGHFLLWNIDRVDCFELKFIVRVMVPDYYIQIRLKNSQKRMIVVDYI